MIIIKLVIVLLLCICGGFLIFRCIKPKMKKSERYKRDLQDIKQQWLELDGEGEPNMSFVYEFSCEYERTRIYTKVGLFITGLIIICFGLGLLNEVINWK